MSEPQPPPEIPSWFVACCRSKHEHGVIHAVGSDISAFVCATCQRIEQLALASPSRASVDRLRPWPETVTNERLFAMVRRWSK